MGKRVVEAQTTYLPNSHHPQKGGEIMLNSYKVTSIRKKSGMVIFGSPQTVVDEGDIYRIAELHVISKGMIVKCEKEDGVVRLTMKNGEVIEFGVTCGR